MSDYSYLKPGLRWAREKKGRDKQERGEWCIIKITGKQPFLTAEIVYRTGLETIYTGLHEPDRWEYGQEIEIPSTAILEVVTMAKEK